VAAWVGIVAGVVFIVAVVFFSGFILGAHSGGPRGGHPRHEFSNGRMGPPPMFPMHPNPSFGGPGGPGMQPPQPPQPPGVPSTTAPARP